MPAPLPEIGALRPPSSGSRRRAVRAGLGDFEAPAPSAAARAVAPRSPMWQLHIESDRSRRSRRNALASACAAASPTFTFSEMSSDVTCESVGPALSRRANCCTSCSSTVFDVSRSTMARNVLSPRFSRCTAASKSYAASIVRIQNLLGRESIENAPSLLLFSSSRAPCGWAFVSRHLLAVSSQTG